MVFNYILRLIRDSERSTGKLLFLDAPGGTGKTFLLNVLISWIRMQKYDVATSTSSGIAATLLHLGRTSHNQFKLPLNPHKDSLCNIKKRSELAQFLIRMVLAIFDEGPMLNKLCYEAFDKSMRDLAQVKEDK